jgi:iron complex outermembrane receptor protein
LVRAQARQAYADVTTEWVDRISVNDQEDEYAPSYGLVHVRAGLDAVRLGGLSFGPFAGVSNLLDEVHFASVAVNAFGRRYYEPGPRRSFHVGMSAGWGH